MLPPPVIPPRRVKVLPAASELIRPLNPSVIGPFHSLSPPTLLNPLPNPVPADRVRGSRLTMMPPDKFSWLLSAITVPPAAEPSALPFVRESAPVFGEDPMVVAPA